jgi:acyl-coenzyme A synthetase/AMP-(fatty) acid ligase/aryl carrier-like protein
MTLSSTQDTLLRRFHAVAGQFGDRLAMQGSSGDCRYRELDTAADALAARIRPIAGQGERVALLSDPGIEAVQAVLATVKAGATCVPLDPQQPTKRLAEIVAGTSPALILTDGSHAPAAQRLADGRPVLPAAAEPNALPLQPDDSPDTLAWILHTPGAPDGVTQTNRDLLAHALAFADRIGLTAEDRMPIIARSAFDISAADLFGALLTGASLHVINPYQAPPSTLLGDLAAHQATVLHCTSTLLRLFLAQLESGAPAPELRAIVVRGEELRDVDAAGLARHFPAAELINGFGREDYRSAEPAEAEVLLRAHPTVRHAAVVADLERPPGHRVTGYVTSPGPQGAQPRELRRYLLSTLPDYAVPEEIVVLPRLPVGPDGRLDLSRLPAPPQPSAEAESDNAPQNSRESQLAALWCEVLGRTSAHREDHFFACGGDSARVMHLLAQIKTQQGAAVSMPAFLADPTLATLQKLVAAGADPTNSELPTQWRSIRERRSGA